MRNFPNPINKAAALFELSKSPLTALVVLTAAVAFILASDHILNLPNLLSLIIGIALTAGGANAFNQWWERELDARMERTGRRPLPSGRLSPCQALFAACVMTFAGGTILLLGCNALAAGLALCNVVLYLLVYTPLKLRTSACTLVGAVVGAVPPMVGWAAATGRLEVGAWVLAALLFTWQIPHFLSLAWIYREDYRRAGFKMLPFGEHGEKITVLLIVLYSLTLMPVGLAAALMGVAGTTYALGATLMGGMLALLSGTLLLRQTPARARAVFWAGLIYLPLLLGLMLADKTAGARDSLKPIQMVDFSGQPYS